MIPISHHTKICNYCQHKQTLDSALLPSLSWQRAVCGPT